MSRNFNNRVSVIVPFFKYQNISSFKKGAYTNYFYYVKGGSYTFNIDSYIPTIKSISTLLNYKFKGAS
jgi:hypothetical protein